MPRFIAILATGSVACMLLAGAASADSRLFSARSDQSGVTITGANLNGKDLAVAGQGGGVTFFRVDNPGGSVPCAERIAFTGSDGRVVTIDADICASGAQVTVPFSTIAATPPPTPPPAKAPPTAPRPAQSVTPPPAPQAQTTPPPIAGQPGGIQPVVIGLDVPAVSIDAVFMAGKPVAINRRIGTAVEVLVAAGPNGVACSRDLGLVLSDGRRIARDVDICANNWQVNVTLLSSGSPGTATTEQPSAAPSSPPPVSPPAEPAGQPAPVVSDYAWMFTSTTSNGSLAFAVPNSEVSEFTAVCAPASNEVTVALGRSAPEVKPGAAITIGFSAGLFSQNYQATGSDVSQESGLSNPLIKLKTDDPLWSAIIGESALSVRIGARAPYMLSLKGSSAKARQFLAYCSPAPPVVSAPSAGTAPMPGAGGGIAFACDDGSFIDVVFDDANSRVIVTEGGGGPPMSLGRVASQRGARYAGNSDVLVGYAETITWSRGGSYPSTCRPR